mmetsp:Transcript_10990/g.20954  ORF Transcript_10990/g.20954 Transcript_10990/m.20954 type:complete len:102 (+) Transcript_10990:1932-2237(+)
MVPSINDFSSVCYFMIIKLVVGRSHLKWEGMCVLCRKSMEESMAKIKASNNRPSSAHANRRTSIDLSKPQLYNNRAVGRNEDKSAVPLRLQQAGQRANNRR